MAKNILNFSFSSSAKLIVAIAVLLLVFTFLGLNIYGQIYHTAAVIGQQHDLHDKFILLTHLATAQEQLLGLLFISMIVIIAFGAAMAVEAVFRARYTDRLSEKRLAAIEAAGDGIGIIGSDGNLTYMNHALLELHGLKTEDMPDYIGSPWVSLYTERGGLHIRENVMPVLEKIGKWRGESPIIRKDGTMVYAEMSLTRLQDGVIIGTARDVTEQKKTEAEKEALRKQFVQAQKMEALGRLTGGIAHDFNNMLTVINGNLDLLEDFIPDNPTIEKHIAASRRAVERGSELTQRLLAFSRKQILKPVTANINDVIPETIKLIKRLLHEDIKIISDLGENIWPVEIDVGQLENAIVNLCINARDALPEYSAGSITFKTRNVLLDQGHLLWQGYMSPGAYTVVSVIDTGSGIPPDILGRVFEPFFTTKDAGKGSGLGLSMVYGFVKQSRGYVTIDSTVGSGTSVNLFFPRILPKKDGNQDVFFLRDYQQP